MLLMYFETTEAALTADGCLLGNKRSSV